MTENPDSHAAATDAPADRRIPAEERHRLQRCYEQSQQLMGQDPYDHDHAHMLLADCVVNDPGCTMYVEAMLENLRRKHGGQPQGKRLPLFRGVGKFKRTVAEERWDLVLQTGPDLLKYNPWDLMILQAMASACAAHELGHAELAYLRMALESHGYDIALQRQTARALARHAMFDKALAHWRQVEELDPYDIEAPRMISTLTLQRARHFSADDATRVEDEAGPDAHAAGDAGKSATESTDEPKKQKPRKLVLTHRQVLEQAILNNPENEENYLELAELHLAEQRTYDAQRTLLKALDVTRNLQVLEKLEDVNIQRALEQIEIAEQRYHEGPTAEARELVQKLRDESLRLELEIYTARSQRTPDDPALRFQIGFRLKQLGSIRQALEPLQAGLEVPEFRAIASLEIGEILQRYQQFPKALQCYRQAVQLAAPDEKHEECRRRALYRAGILAESMQLNDSALEYFQELFRIAPNYKDTKSRLDNVTRIVQNT